MININTMIEESKKDLILPIDNEIENDNYDIVRITSENEPIIVNYAIISNKILYIFLLEPVTTDTNILVELVEKTHQIIQE